MLCEDVRRVVRAENLGKSKIALLQSVLDPQISHMKVSDLAQSATAAYADRCRSVGQYLYFKIYAQIVSNRLEAKCQRRSTTNAAELSFA